MSRSSVLRRLQNWFCEGLGWGIAFLLLTPPQPAGLFVSLYLVLKVLRIGAVYWLSHEDGLQWISRRLNQGDHGVTTLYFVGQVFGDRFGNPNYGGETVNEWRRQLWCDWIEEHKDRLIWDDSFGCYRVCDK